MNNDLRKRDPAYHAMISTLERLSVQAAEEAKRAKIAWGAGELFRDIAGDSESESRTGNEINYEKLYRKSEKTIADLQYEVEYLRRVVVEMGHGGA